MRKVTMNERKCQYLKIILIITMIIIIISWFIWHSYLENSSGGRVVSGGRPPKQYLTSRSSNEQRPSLSVHFPRLLADLAMYILKYLAPLPSPSCSHPFSYVSQPLAEQKSKQKIRNR